MEMSAPKSFAFPDHYVQLSKPRPRWDVVHSIGVAVVALAGLAWWASPFGGETSRHQLPIAAFSWDRITPSPSLEYHDCFDGLQCARLQVPMDYHRSDGQGRHVAIAIARRPAKVPVTDMRYGGAILVNPGGPGGSGVAMVLLGGDALQTTVDAENDPNMLSTKLSDKYFDIIGFDPRGVNNTTPGFSCFPNLFSQRNWELQAAAEGILGSSEDAFRRNWDRAIALNTGCSTNLSTPVREGQEALGEHINTVPVARDMLEIAERHGEWREKQGLAEQRRRDRVQGYDPRQRLVARTRWNRGQEKIQYWGRSYGTILGATFATLFPDRVHRAVLDAVVDADKYYLGDGHSAIEDADAIFDRFTQYCDAVGADGCPFYREGGPAAIKASYLALDRALYNRSVPVPSSTMRGPEVVTWSDLKHIIRIAMYQPLSGFPLLAEYASELVNGNGAPLADFKVGGRSPSCPSSQCLQRGPWSAACQVPGHNELYSSAAILCADAEYLQSADEDDFGRYWQSLREDSYVLGDYWAGLGLSCVGWKVKPRWTLPGPVAANTSHPLLFVSNILDPVTPLRSARKMTRRFPGSVLLQQDSEGHSTLAAPSVCVHKAIRTYFQTGELPPPDTVCEGDIKPLLGVQARTGTVRSAGDQRLYEVLAGEARRMAAVRLPL
ncbi:proteinase [Aspergillus heteromorphus CBS 117.55]|uniref:Proteinase n=1 Tax=Aspergillus heteromorphus CBS 117.55 TaxID=1448321 RepID=A0A317WN09_9EURO|nr:proteinase [Aspergillus heteromorphus CBS 117.55]PWY86662.1 proteinase [Aspergillus heteromorphus CBS 117.55]